MAAQELKISKSDVRYIIILSGWFMGLFVTFCAAVGLISPAENTLQYLLVSKLGEPIIFVMGTAFGAWLFKTKETTA